MDFLTANDRPGLYPKSSYAAATPPLAAFPRLEGALKADVCVIGGGFTGLSAALHLAERGYRVALLEAQRVGFGASGRNGGQVAREMRVDQTTLETMLGDAHARALWELAGEANRLVRTLAASDLVDTPFHPGVVHAAHKRRYVRHYADYVEKLRTRYGYEQMRALDLEGVRDLVRSDAYYGGALDLEAGHLDPLRFALGLARAADAAGARIFEASRVLAIEETRPARVKTADGEVVADHVVLACNGYLGDLNAQVAARVMPINNFIVATAPLEPAQRERLIKRNYAVADSKFVVNYFRFSDDGRLLFGGTESYGYRFPRDIAKNVRRPLGRIFPEMRDVQIDYAWGGTLAITMNRLPHYARLGSGSLLSMSGFSGSGVALGALSGRIAAETIAGQAERFDLIERIPTPPFPGGRMFRAPLLVLAMLWFTLRDRL